MNKTDRLLLWIIAAAFLAIVVFCVVWAARYAPTAPVENLKLQRFDPSPVDDQDLPVNPPLQDVGKNVPPEDMKWILPDASSEPENPAERKAAPPPCCGKECNGFGMDRPNCLAADCHCGDDCQFCESFPCCPDCLCCTKPTTPQKPAQTPSAPARGPAWFYCLTCRSYSEYTAPVTLRSTKCRNCGQWGAYRAVKPKEKPAADYETPSDYYERDSPGGWRQWRPFGGMGFGGGFGDASNGQACAGTT